MYSRTVLKYSDALKALLASGPFNTRVRGRCMEPLVPDGSLVSVDPHARLCCGDVMVWRNSAGRLVCHRYLGRFPGRQGIGWVSWADNAGAPDALVPASCVMGKVVQVDDAPLADPGGNRWRFRRKYLEYFAFRLRKLLK